MNNGTATIVNSCLNGKMGFMEYLKAVFALFKNNIKDLTIICLLAQVPVMASVMFKLPNNIITVIGMVIQIISMIAVIKLIDNKARGNKVNAISAVKLVRENALHATGAILFQAFLFGIGRVIPFAHVIIGVILAVSIPMGALENKSMIQSAVDSFKLVKPQMIDVLGKILILSIVTGAVMIVFRMIVLFIPSTLLIINLLAAILATVQLISALVLFYNLPTVEHKSKI